MPDNHVPPRYQWTFDNYGITRGDLIKDKPALISSYVLYMLTRTQRMFEYDGLPDTIPQRNLEMLLQINGFAVFAKVPNKGLYAFRAGLGGVPNAYYEPTRAIIANPGLAFNLNGEIDKDVALVRNDCFYQGLMPMLSKYCALLAEGDISIRYALINSRLTKILTANDDNTKVSAEKVLKSVEDGKELALFLADSSFVDSLRESNAPSKDTYIKDLDEAYQYQKASLFNELGIRSNFNMKREAINETESALNDDALLPLIEEMLEERRKGLERVNALFGTNISVRLSSAWEKRQKVSELETKAVEKAIEDPQPSEDPKPEEGEKKEEKEDADAK